MKYWKIITVILIITIVTSLYFYESYDYQYNNEGTLVSMTTHNVFGKIKSKTQYNKDGIVIEKSIYLSNGDVIVKDFYECLDEFIMKNNDKHKLGDTKKMVDKKISEFKSNVKFIEEEVKTILENLQDEICEKVQKNPDLYFNTKETNVGTKRIITNESVNEFKPLVLDEFTKLFNGQIKQKIFGEKLFGKDLGTITELIGLSDVEEHIKKLSVNVKPLLKNNKEISTKTKEIIQKIISACYIEETELTVRIGVESDDIENSNPKPSPSVQRK